MSPDYITKQGEKNCEQTYQTNCWFWRHSLQTLKLQLKKTWFASGSASLFHCGTTIPLQHGCCCPAIGVETRVSFLSGWATFRDKTALKFSALKRCDDSWRLDIGGLVGIDSDDIFGYIWHVFQDYPNMVFSKWRTPWCSTVKKKKVTPSPQKSSGKSFSGSVLLMNGILFPLDHPIFQILQNTILFCREAIDFRHFRPQMLRHCLGKYKTRNPFAQKPPQWTAHRKTFQMQRTCRFKGAMESLENCSMWKYRMSWRFHVFRLFQKTRSWFELPSDPLFRMNSKLENQKKSLWTLLNFF